MLPDAFSKIITTYDPLLSLRWGDRTGCWIIDRKRTKRPTDTESKYLRHFGLLKNADPRDVEHLWSAQRGKQLLFFTNVLDNTVFDKIRLRDIQKSGFAILDKRAAEEKKKQQAIDSVAHEKAREGANVISHLLRKQDSAMLHGHADEIMRAALKLPPRPKPKPTVTVLADAYGVVPKKDAPKIQLATR